MRKCSLKAGHEVFPPYHRLCKSKRLCYPSNEHISITEKPSKTFKKHVPKLIFKAYDALISK